jgi:hypothetical protein
MSPDNTTLRTLLSEAVTAADPTLRERLLTNPDAYLDLVDLTARARAESEVLLRLAVAGARSAGCTWEAIGRVLDMTRQAAQQRYGAADVAGVPPGAVPSDERIQRLAPVTAFNEMRVLERAGRYGWEVIGCGTATQIVRKTDVQWEHQRVFASRTAGRHLEEQGWTRCADSWFPWAYYKRPTGRPAEPEPTNGDYLMRP